MIRLSRAALVAASLTLAVPATIALAEDSASPATPGSPQLAYSLSVPTVVAVGSSMDESAIRESFTGNFLNHVDELAALNATSITIPEITFTSTVTVENAVQAGTATYKNIVFSNVKDGVAESVTMDGSESTTNEGKFAYGKLVYNNVSIADTLAVIGLVPPRGNDFKTLFTDYSVDGATFSSPDFSCKLGAWSGKSTEGKPVTVMLKDMMAAAQQLQSMPDSPPPAAIKTVVTYVTDLITGFRTSPSSVDGFDCSGTVDGKPLSVGFTSLSVSAFEPGIYPAISLAGFKVDAGPQGTVSIDKIELKQIDLNPPVAAVRANIDALDAAWFEKNARLLVPSFAGFAMSGIKIDVADPQTEGARVQASLADFDLSMSDYVNGIPTRFSSKATGFDIPIPDDTTDPQLAMLKSLGINRLTLNYDLGAGWDKDTNTLSIDKVAISGDNLGSIAVAAVIGNATSALFDVDPNVQQAAGLGVTLKSLTLDLGDAGIADIAMPIAAQQQGADPATFRQQMAATAEGAAIAMLGSSDGARAVGKAMSDFIAGAQKNITVTITSKDPAGLPVPLLMQSQNDPSVLQSAVDVTATTK